MDRPLVTIILPAYERPDSIRSAISSALGQSLTGFVLRIGDDSASDAVLNVVREFDDPRIDYRRNTCRLGPKGNWAALLRSVDTPFVASLNDDDEWTPELLASLVPPLLEHDEVVVSFADFWLIDATGEPLVARTQDLSTSTRRDRLPRGTLAQDTASGLRLVAAWNAPQPAICAVMRTEVVRQVEFPDEVRSIHDLWLSYQVVRGGGAFHFTPMRLARYRWHASSLTQTMGFAEEEDYVFGRIVEENAGAGPVVEEVLAHWAMIRWGRAMGMMSDPRDQSSSQAQLRAAAVHLPHPRRLAATVAGRSSLAWHALAHLRSIRRRRSADRLSRSPLPLTW